MSQLSLLRSSGTLKRFSTTRTKDAAGGMAPNTATEVDDISTDVACDVQPASSNTVTQFMQRQLNVDTTIYLATDIGALAGDIFEVGTMTFKVVGYMPPAPGYTEWPGVIHASYQPQSV